MAKRSRSVLLVILMTGLLASGCGGGSQADDVAQELPDWLRILRGAFDDVEVPLTRSGTLLDVSVLAQRATDAVEGIMQRGSSGLRTRSGNLADSTDWNDYGKFVVCDLKDVYFAWMGEEIEVELIGLLGDYLQPDSAKKFADSVVEALNEIHDAYQISGWNAAFMTSLEQTYCFDLPDFD